MTLALPGDPIADFNIQQKFDEIALRWQNDVPGVPRLIGAAGQPAFLNGWVNFGAGEPAASFYRDRGRVYLAGSVKSGTVAAPMFTLPIGHRPPSDTVRYPVVDGSGGPAGYILIFSNGNVQLQVGNNTYVSLAPVHFRVA